MLRGYHPGLAPSPSSAPAAIRGWSPDLSFTFFGRKTVDVTEMLFRTQPILDWLAYSAEYADGRVFALDTVTTGVIGCMTEVAKKLTERPCE